MTDMQCLAKLESVLAENEALTARVLLLEQVNEGFIAVKDLYEDLRKENEEFGEQLEYLKQKLFDLYGIPSDLIENASIKTATQIAEYENKKLVEHLKKSIDIAINTSYTELKAYNDFVNNYKSINDSNYFI